MYNIESYIKYYENIIDKNLCSTIINNEFNYTHSTYSTDTEIKVIKKNRVVSEDYWIKENDKYFLRLKESYKNAIFKYQTNFQALEINSLTDFRISRYKVGSFMSKHVDNIHHSHGQNYGYPQLTGLLFLNDDYKGGEIIISGKCFNVKTGSALIFPSNFIYPHEVLMVKKGVRYSITCWML